MKPIVKYIRLYYQIVNKRSLLSISLFTALLIFINFYFGIDDKIRTYSWLTKLSLWYLEYCIAFIIPYFIVNFVDKSALQFNKRFLTLLFIAPLLFALKQTINFDFHFTENIELNSYWQKVIYWPALLLISFVLIYFIWLWNDKKYQPFYGFKAKGTNWRPYWLMLVFMIPLIAAASTQNDFLAVYPKLQSLIELSSIGEIPIWQKVLYELSYGSDFINIELFFRGFLVLAFIKWAGKDALLPMACFYCAIHFGKPLGECISSFFGGMLLGIIVYNTRSILGGLIVHLGIAWMMELGGFIGNDFLNNLSVTIIHT
ncbi:MAG: CPBP family intramembrane metalloprotease [Bacteroidetes bacterium]|nr:CPBP family intramembrane metalloprotease [Bacteroidota bacterium]